MHGSRKGLDHHRILEKQTEPIVRLDEERKPRIGQGRESSTLFDSRQGTSASKPIVITEETKSKMPRSIVEIPTGGMFPPYVEPLLRPPPKPPDNISKRLEIESSKIEIEENSPFQESIISEIYERPDKSYFQE